MSKFSPVYPNKPSLRNIRAVVATISASDKLKKSSKERGCSCGFLNASSLILPPPPPLFFANRICLGLSSFFASLGFHLASWVCLSVALVGGRGVMAADLVGPFSSYCPVAINGFNKDGLDITKPRPTPLRMTHERHKNDPKHYSVVFFGDSMIEKWHQEQFEKDFGDLRAGRFGISGDRVEHFIWRIQQGEMDRQNPDVVVVWGGTNNAGVNTDQEIAQGMAFVLQMLRTKWPKAKLVMLGLMPAGKEPDTGWRRQLRCINAKLSQLSLPATLLMLGDLVIDQRGFLNPELMADVIHLNGRGYAQIGPLIRKTILGLLPTHGGPSP